MTTSRLDHLKAQITNRTPLVGHLLRQQAAKELLTDGTDEALRILAEALMTTDDRRLAALIRTGLAGLTTSYQVETLCAIWQATRHPELAELLVQQQWVAELPLDLRVLTALKAGRLDLLSGQGVTTVAQVIGRLTDSDPEIAERARTVLTTLPEPAAREEVCRRLIAADNPPLLEIARSAGYLPQDDTRRAIYFLATGQWDKYDALDFDHALLTAAYPSLDQALRQRLLEKARAAGRVELLTRSAVGGRQPRRLGEMTDSEWRTVVAALTGSGHHAELWALARAAPPVWSARILQRLGSVKWEPPGDARYAELVRRAAPLNPDRTRLALPAVRLPRSEEVGEPVRAMVTTRDGLTLLTGDESGRIALRRLPDGALLEFTAAHRGPIRSLALAAYDQVLVSGGDDSMVRVWQMPARRLHKIFKMRDNVTCVSISAGARTVAAGAADGVVSAWHMSDGERYRFWEEYKHATGGYKYVSETLTRTGHRGAITGLVQGTEGQFLSSGSLDGTVRTRLMPQCEPFRPITDLGSSVTSLALTPDDRTLVIGGGDGTIRLWGAPEGRQLRELTGHQGAVHCLVLDASGQILVSTGVDNTVRRWQLRAAGAPANLLRGAAGPISCLALTRDGAMLVAGGDSPDLWLWRLDLNCLPARPVAAAVPTDLQLVRDYSPRVPAGDPDHDWLDFIAALMEVQLQFDISVQPSPGHVIAGDYDIELAAHEA